MLLFDLYYSNLAAQTFQMMNIPIKNCDQISNAKLLQNSC